MRINIALGMTPNWFEFARVTVGSVLLNARPEDEYHFFIMANEFCDYDRKMFTSLNAIHPAEFEFILIDDSFFDGAIHDWLGVSSSYRLRLPSLVHESKVLYLDSDIIAVQDISPLYETDISDYYLAGVEDKCSEMMKSRVNLSEDDIFFNGGMQLINLDAFRENNLEKIIMKKLRESTFYTDQDVINDVCRGKILSLPLKYNIMPCSGAYQTRQEEFIESINNPVLIHFTDKPWNGANCQHADTWFQYKIRVRRIKV